MLIANGLVCLIVVFVLGGTLLLRPLKQDTSTLWIDDVALADQSEYDSTSESLLSGQDSKRKKGMFVQPQRLGYEHAGWIDASRLVIVPDNNAVITTMAVAVASADDLGPDIPDTKIEPNESEFGFGGDDNYGLPPARRFFDIHISEKELPEVFGLIKPVMNMPDDHGIIINSNDVKRYVPQFPARALAKRIDSGVVRLEVTIDEEGKIKHLKLLDEQPRNFGFAEALQEMNVLSRWRITPPRKNGKSFGCSFPLTYMFCLNCPVEIRIDNPVP